MKKSKEQSLRHVHLEKIKILRHGVQKMEEVFSLYKRKDGLPLKLSYLLSSEVKGGDKPI